MKTPKGSVFPKMVFALIASGICSAQVVNPTVTPSPKGVVFPSVLITVSRFGISPQAISIPQGPFVLYIQHAAPDGNEQFALSMDETTDSLLSLATTENNRVAYKLIELLPGKYRLELKNRSNLHVDLTITPK